ncbi:MAG: Fe-S cluster assembly protein SufB [Methanobacteriota archaeon]|nr:MAG: Fe-S cluster assembly protein SufB [Euryarchaeota archaeon]
MNLGPTEDLVRQLSAGRGEPNWMLRQRLRGLDLVRSDGVPAWAAFLREIDFGAIVSSDGPPAEANAPRDSTVQPGLGALEESEEAYRAVRTDLESRGIRFYGLPTALARIPDSLRTYLASVIPPDDDPIAALNAALWTEGSFLYVPPGVSVGIPLQAEIRADYTKVEPFERNVIVADRGAEVTYIEGCTAPVYTADELHLSAIEVVAMPGSRVRYIALQNFSKKVDNLVTKRAQVHDGASLEWVDVNLGSRRTWKVPRANLVGPGANADFIGVAFAGRGQHEDVGAEMVHLAPRTRSRIVNHGIVKKGGRATLRSGVRVATGATEAVSSVTWSSLMLDAESRAETNPSIEVDEADAEIGQEGKVRKVGEEMLFYMSSRGVPADEAIRMVVLGIASEATRRIPVEYAVEVDRLLELELSGGIG